MQGCTGSSEGKLVDTSRCFRLVYGERACTRRGPKRRIRDGIDAVHFIAKQAAELKATEFYRSPAGSGQREIRPQDSSVSKYDILRSPNLNVAPYRFGDLSMSYLLRVLRD